MHIKCTYNGVQLSEKEFHKNWLTDGMQIKILSPFCLKPWHKSMIRPYHQDKKKKEQNQIDAFCFLTVVGLETDIPFGPPRKRLLFFNLFLNNSTKKLKNL